MDMLSVHYYQRKVYKEVEESEAQKTCQQDGRKAGNLGREGAKIGSLLGMIDRYHEPPWSFYHSSLSRGPSIA